MDTPYGNYDEFDLPVSAYEKLDMAFSRKVLRDAVKIGFEQWLEDTAREYFCDVGDWNDEWKDAWREVVLEII